MPEIYIEDYALSFLKQMKTEASEAPVKLALFGTAEKPKTLDIISENEKSHYIYGAATLEENRTAKEIGEEHFPEYQFIGYVNVYNNGEASSKYHIFYEENTAMQDYLLKNPKER